MSRYTGPRVKVMRALGVDLPGLTPKTIERRPYPPGQHGNRRRRKETEFGKRLKEKQKLRMNYGLSEKAMLRLYDEARRSKENTGSKFLELLERRLDNAVFRAGFARSIPAARQIVNHGHILVDGKRVDIPSFRIQKGQVISFRKGKENMQAVTQGLELHAQRHWTTPWLEVNAEERKAEVTALPEPDSVLFAVDIQLVIEWYARGA